MAASTSGMAEQAKDVSSRPCLAACGAMISGRDPHAMCIVCMGTKHAQASLVDPDSCDHCRGMSTKILERRLRVAATSKGDPPLNAHFQAGENVGKTTQQPPIRDWGEFMEMEPLSAQPPLAIEDHLLEDAGAAATDVDEEDDEDMISNILRDDQEEEEEGAFLRTETSRPASSQGGEPQTSTDFAFVEICKRAAAKLGVEWPASPGAPGAERDLYDGKRLPSRLPPAKHLLAVLPCDLRDAYLHIGVFSPHRKYLRFAFQGRVYEYLSVPYGLSLAPRTFTKVIEAALIPLRQSGLRISAFLDDYLLCAATREQAQLHTAALIGHLSSLGFNINHTKSHLSPSQTIEYLGVQIDSLSFRATLSEERIKAFHQCLSLFRRNKTVSFRTCLRLLGLMASSTAMIPFALLRMREFQRWVASLRLCPRRHLRRIVRISPVCLTALNWWKNPQTLRTGSPLGVVYERKVVTTDASLTGWGAVHEGRSANGTWPAWLRDKHIHFLELLAVFLALEHFLQYLHGCHVLIRTDNTTVVAYINRQGGTRSLQLHKLARRLILWSSTRISSLRATHVPGIMNTGADLLSRGNPLYGEWRLHPQVVNQIWERYGKATVDLFASHENAQCPLFFSLKDADAPLGVDALTQPWPNALLYAFPPLSLISPALARVREHGLSLLLIAPNWPGRLWLAEISQMLAGEPWPLPLRRDLLSQAQGQILHPRPDRLALWVWPVSG
ncbi:uncharacterized protein LOC143138537 [Alosa pseudoharengus]|uniref:uncharacterized protein LOC143138537 n=1 Tax=Alosa pseudoharengus TaxID=34774 RepID=UPI003F8CC203